MFSPESALPLVERKAAIITALSAPALQEFDHYQYLLKLQQNLDPALQVARKENSTTARVIQFADFHLHIPEDQSFISCLLDELGAYVVLPGKIGPVAVDSENLATIVTQLERVIIPDNPDWRIPDAAVKQAYSSGQSCRITMPYGMDQIILQTNIPGVRLLAEYNDSTTHDFIVDETGQASLSDTSTYFNTFRPMLLFDITAAEAAALELAPEPVDRRVSWLAIHGRSTENPQKPGQSTLVRRFNQALIRGDELEMEVAEVAAARLPRALPAEEILVTPTELTEQPALAEADRVSAVSEALRVAGQHLRKSPADQKVFFPTTVHSLLIMTEVFGMNAAEIMRDQEALTDLVAYLEMIVLNTEATDDPNRELVQMIRQTWHLPPTHLGSNKMYDRVIWAKRQPPLYGIN